MKFDPELEPLIPLLPTGDPYDVPGLRKIVADMMEMLRGLGIVVPGEDRVVVEERLVPGPPGDPDVRVRIYRPKDRPGPLPALLHFHGGGFTVGDLDQEHAPCVMFADQVGLVAVAVDYRLAPEHPFPAPVDDCYAALCWVAENAAELGVDPTRIAVGGGSAGGTLAAAVALMARDRAGPAIAFQLLNIPAFSDIAEGPSMQSFTDTPMLFAEAARAVWVHYLGRERGEVSPYAAPARATDLSGLPPALMQIAEYDPLRDDALDYARRLMEADVSVELHVYPRAFHGFEVVPTAEITQRALAERVIALRKALHLRTPDG